MKPREIQDRRSAVAFLKWAAVGIGAVIVLGLAAFGALSLIAV